MIEWLLDAERCLAEGRLDDAESRFGLAVSNDPRNAIAVVGLARVAIARGDETAAAALIARALEIDPENAAARRHALELPDPVSSPSMPATPPAIPPATTPVTTSQPTEVPPARRSLLDRILGRG